MSYRLQVLATLTCAGIMAVSSCKPEGGHDSGAKSLDGLVTDAEGGKRADLTCGGPFTSVDALPEHVRIMLTNNRITGPEAFKNEASATLTAAPFDMVRLFI